MRLAAVTTVTALAAAAAPAAAQCAYDVVLIGGPDCGIFGSATVVGQDINNDGVVVGQLLCAFSVVAIRWDPISGLQTLQTGHTDATATRAVGLNDAEEIAGQCEFGDSARSGFVLTSRGTQTIDPPPEATWLDPRGIGADGTVFGSWINPVGGTGRVPFLWRDGELTSFVGLLGATHGEIRDMNASGVFVGWRSDGGFLEREAFVYDEETLRFLGPVPGGVSSYANGINPSGLIVGAGSRDSQTIAAIWDGPSITLIEPFPQHEHSSAVAVNRVGQVVGESWGPIEPRAFLWQNGTVRDLNELVVPELGPLTALLDAQAINSLGQITGRAMNGIGVGDAYVATPRRMSDADITIDCRVDAHDLMYLLRHWGTADEATDVDQDGLVGFADLTELLANWG